MALIRYLYVASGAAFGWRKSAAIIFAPGPFTKARVCLWCGTWRRR